MFSESFPECRMLDLQATQSIIPRAQIQPLRPCAEFRSSFEVADLHLVGVFLNERICILSEATRRCEEQSLMVWCFGQQALDEFETERHCVPDELGIVV